MKVGDKIRELREQKNLTRKELATNMNMTVAAIELIENNKNKSITMERLEQFAQFFDVPITEFFEQNSYIQNNSDNSKSNINQNIGSIVFIQDNEDAKEVLEKVMTMLKKVMENIGK
jgi:transcriptional regulator with XRE-family HTH domain